MPSDIDIAWAAGLFEGEGCFFATTKLERKTGTQRRCHSAQLATTDLDVLKRFHAIVGVGGIIKIHERRKLTYKPLWRWQIQSRSGVEYLGELFRPYLGERRTAKLDEVLAIMSVENDSITCDYCGTEFVPERKRPGRAFCRKACAARYQAGVLNPRKEYA